MKKIKLSVFMWLVTAFSFVAIASLPSDGFYHLRIVRVGDTPGIHDNKYLSVDPLNPDSLVIVDSLTMSKQVDYSLWSFTTINQSYQLFNKKGRILAFDEPANPIAGNGSNNAKEAVAMIESDGSLALWNDILYPFAFTLQSGKEGVSYALAVNDHVKSGLVTLVGAVGNTTAKYMVLSVEKPSEQWMTANQLNEKLGNGFKLFFYYDQMELTAKLTPDSLNGVKLVGELDVTTIPGTSLLYLHTEGTGSEKKYLYVDTASYVLDDSELLYGRKMILKLDTIPNSLKAYYGIRSFAFRVDPGSFKDSVAVFVKGSFGKNKATGKWDYINKEFPVQIDYSPTLQKYYLVTDSLTADSSTRIAFKEIVYPTQLKKTTVYSVKVLNNAPSYTERKGKYWIATLKGETGYADKVYDHLPYTQFVYDGAQLVNRDTKKVVSGSLFKISPTEDFYTNLKDTLEIKEMKSANKVDTLLGYAYYTAESLQSESFKIDISSGGFAGKAIGMRSDSVVGILEGDSKNFKMEADSVPESYGANPQDKVAGLKRQAYYFKSAKNEYIHVQNSGKIVMTATAKTPFYLKSTPNADEYIFIYQMDSLKLQVNSQSGSLEAVDAGLVDNLIRLRPESDFVVYKKDAKGYYELSTHLGQKLTMNATGYAVYRNEGESVLKSGVYGADDFKMWIDTAQGTGRSPEKPSYYIVKNAKKGTGEELSGYFLHVLDSGKVADPTPYQVEIGGILYNRLNFVDAKRFSGDSLLLNYQSATPAMADSIGYTGKNEKAIKEYRFLLREADGQGEYLLVAEQGYNGQGNADGYLSMLNDILFIGPRSTAYPIRLAETSAPMANEQVADLNQSTIVSESGAVTILNAAGRHVAIRNVLGQPVADKVLSTDQERITVPQGIVIVTVAGENPVKAMVK